MNNNSEFVIMPIPVSRFTQVCALLGGAALAGYGFSKALAGEGSGNAGTTDAAPSPAAEQSENGAEASLAAATSGGDNVAASDSSGELDAAGWPWSADLHASTKGKTKDGLWRMKVGVARPDPKPGFPVDSGGQSAGTPTNGETTSNSATSQTATEAANGPAATSTDDDDEFAAFRQASEASEQVDNAAAANVPARQFTDADLGALCNQAAVKLGDPGPIKALIAQYVPEGQVAHSRNIPADKRDEFAKAVEAKAGIQFAG